MTNTSIQAAGEGSIMSKLISMFFKGLDNILDSAIEYQNDNGILKGNSVIPVKDKHNKDTEFIVSLSPVDGKGNAREGTFIVNFSCKGINDLITEVDGVDYQDKAIVIDSKTRSKFEDIIGKILKANGLYKIPDKTETNQDEGSHSETRRVDATTTQKKNIVVTIQIYQIPETNRYDIAINADSDVEHNFSPKEVKGGEKLADTIYDWFDKNSLEIRDDNDDDWIQSMRHWDEEPVESSKKINMTVHKSITASETVVDVVKIYANYDVDEAMVAVDSMLDSDEFIDSLDEGDTNLVVIDDGQDLDIQPTADCCPIIPVVTDMLTASTALYALLANYSCNFDESIQQSINDVLASISELNAELEFTIQPKSLQSPIESPLIIQESL